MTKVYSKAIDKTIDIDRIIGQINGNPSGPTLIFTGGIHGNEPAGVFALHQAINELTQTKKKLSGNVYAISGNLWALERGLRYHKEDLNRIWDEKTMLLLDDNKLSERNNDVIEQIDIFKTIQTIIHNENGPFYFIDLHTTSGSTTPFLVLNDTLLNRKYCMQYPLPIILGIEEYLDGPLLSYINKLGYIAFGFESGQHDETQAIDYHLAFIFLSLIFTGCIGKSDIDYYKYFKVLEKTAINSRDIYEIYYRLGLKPADTFKMHDGFKNFQNIKKGTELAILNGKKIKAAWNGRIFMPLYQNQGDDAFFTIRSVLPIFLKISSILRKIRLDKILPLLPGIYWLSNKQDTLLVNRKITRFFAKQFFHLLGYRSKKLNKTYLVINNREAASRNEAYKNAIWNK